MSTQFSAALTAAIEADLSEAQAALSDSSLEWSWSESSGVVRFSALFKDSERGLTLVVSLPILSSSLVYTSAEFWLEETELVSSSQTKLNMVRLPAPTADQRALFASMTEVLDYVEAWRDRMA